ncbi:urease subunit alpha [Streptomyces mutabilis]|jgi:urease subunit alpha|uniref:urease subunit alpha n=1 Tax=Streptomyces mutabilis TaxID=67332 RepID=UPI0033A67534
MPTLSREQYASLFGPTVGDRFRLADTNLVVEVEKDFREGSYGDEVVYGGGKTMRDGMASAPQATAAQGALDLVITNVVVIDPVVGVVKCDIGVKDGFIAGIGKAGNPQTQDAVDPRLVIGTGTEVIAGEHLIATAGALDSHVHLITPQQCEQALSNGITTLFGGGTGPTDGSNGTTCTPGPFNIARILEAAEDLPVNLGIMGKGNGSLPGSLEEQIEAGAAALKVHEDWGATPAVIDNALSVADRHDIQIAIHTDTLNEGGFFEDTRSAIDGRTIHTFHSEGAGGGHAPDILRVTGEPNVLPSSTNPTLPYTKNSVDELLDMVMVCHHLSHDIPEDVAFADSRVRAETIAAETVLHDRGIISIISSDSQAMGRVGESVTRAFQIAHVCKEAFGPLPEDSERNDNQRVLRYLAKVTINPAIACGVSDHIGSIEAGKLADIVLWPMHSFGAKPKMIIKGGIVSWAQMGDPNASLPTPQPVYYRPSFGQYGRAMQSTHVTFMSQAGIAAGVPEKLGLRRNVLPVRKTRTIGKHNMVRNDVLPRIEVDPETYKVTVDGEVVTIEPAQRLPLNQLFFLV